MLPTRKTLPYEPTVLLTAPPMTPTFSFQNLLYMKNRLQLTTPYPTYKTVTSSYDFVIVSGYQYLLAFDVNYENRTRWVSTGFSAEYVWDDRHRARLHLHTPFDVFPRLDAEGMLQAEGNIYRANLTLSTNSSDMAVAAKAKVRCWSRRVQKTL